jgi:tRNA(Ile)-lysidine synthase
VLAALPDLSPDFLTLQGLRHVALAVSGGSDSMALLRLADRWASSHLPAPILSVLTVDHGLRAGSGAEAARVGEWASALGRDHVTLTWVDPKPLTGIQSKARKARYDLMSAWCLANNADALLTAHTMDDQAETVLMRMRRTTSPDSLSGIPARGQWNGLPVLRPLLGLQRNDLRAALNEMGQGWIEDPSNDDPRFERVRVREAIAGFDRNSISVERLAALAQSCARTVQLLDQCATRWISKWVEETDAGVCFVPAEPFRLLPPALQQRILSRIVSHYGGGGLKPERDELQRLALWVSERDSASPSRCTLAGAVLGRRKAQFWVTREAARIDAVTQIVPASGKMLWDGRFSISAPEGSTVIPAGDARIALGEDVPAFARRAYPIVHVPQDAAGSGAARVAFLRIKPS